MHDSSRPASRTTRRQFAASFAVAGCASLLGACTRTAPPPVRPTTPSPAVPPAQGDSARAPTATPDAASGDAERLVAMVERRYATTFPADHRNDVRGGVARTLELGEALRKVPVTNGADPFTTCGSAVGRRAS